MIERLIIQSIIVKSSPIIQLKTISVNEIILNEGLKR